MAMDKGKKKQEETCKGKVWASYGRDKDCLRVSDSISKRRFSMSSRQLRVENCDGESTRKHVSEKFGQVTEETKIAWESVIRY